LILRRLPVHGLDIIEAKQAESGTGPKTTIGRLSDRMNATFGKTIADLRSAKQDGVLPSSVQSRHSA
jgi:hypothetical protein